MIIEVRSLPSDKAIKENPGLFAAWVETEVLKGYTMHIGTDAYEYSKGGDVMVRFYPDKGIIVVPDDNGVNLDYLYSKMYEYAAPVDEADEQRHRYSNYLRKTKIRDFCFYLIGLYVWMYAAGNPWPVPLRFWVVTIVFVVMRFTSVYLVYFLEERDYIGTQTKQDDVE